MKKITYLMAVITVLLPLVGALAAAGKSLPTKPVNVNTASAEELTQLPGIGKSKAEAIVAYRQAHPFRAASELTEVKGIGPKMLEKLQNYVTVDGASPTPTASMASAKTPLSPQK